MTIDHHVDTERGIVFVTAKGAVSGGDLLDFARRYRAEPCFRSGLDELFDFSDATPADLPADTVRRLAEALAEGDAQEPEGCRAAIVVGSDAVYGLARMYQALREESLQEYRIFRDLAAARTWLGLAEGAGTE